MEKPFEMIKAVDAIKEYVSPETYQKILLECELKEDECQRRMKGIKKEAEFILALHMTLILVRSILFVKRTKLEDKRTTFLRLNIV